ncbi:MAG: CPBP family intramembrane metalloprotease [Lentimicrobiaceae bacterium]|nr:CPBP family intramembrane metalloprotease [Lentimicrobiaceae bacterium]
MKPKRKLVLLRNRIEQITYKKTVLLSVVLAVIISLIFIGFILLVNVFVDIQLENLVKELDFSTKRKILFVLSALVLAPMVETFIFQHLIFHFFKEIRRKGIPIRFIVISSLLFGLAHQVTWTSGVFLGITFFIQKLAVGVILAICYYLFYRKRKHALLSTALIHSVHNLFVITVILWFQ